MEGTRDLRAALRFVVGRIEEQALLSGEPLTEEQRLLLSNLPKTSSIPLMTLDDPESPPQFVPRDTTYERLCALAKTAHSNDRELNPGSSDWEFAFNVLKLNRHPICWVLQWAGVKQRRPWWDRWLLIAAALLFVVLTLTLMLLVIRQTWSLWRGIVVICGYITIMLMAYLASRRVEERQLCQNIERCRSSSRLAGP